jgi:mevalonate kinase
MKVTLSEGFTEQDDLRLLIKNSKIESNIPEGSGLGSSAALSVALARCFSNDQQEIFKIAKKIEDEFHAGSSGLDVFTSANGGLCALHTKFEKLPDVLLKKLCKFRFSIIDTRERRKVSEIKSKLIKEDLDEYLAEASKISKEFGDFLYSTHTQNIKTIAALFDRSQMALVKLKVSSSLINSITSKLKEEFGNYDLGVKITGAGGGGCLLLVHNEIITEEKVVKVLSNYFNINFYYNVQFEF